MKPPQLFRGQPVWASLLVLFSYLLFGPCMEDDGLDIQRPQPAIRDWWVVAGLWFILTFVSFTIFSYSSITGYFLVLASTITSLALTLVVTRKSVIRVLVNSYQRRAPSQVRSLCAQTPRCSDYFLLSVNKHGVLKGGYRGWCRLKRCDGTTREDWP